MAEESAETGKYLRFDALICHERQTIMEWSMTINTFSCPHCSYGHSQEYLLGISPWNKNPVFCFDDRI